MSMLVLERTIPSRLQAIINFLQYFKEQYLTPLSLPSEVKDRIEYAMMEAIDNAHEHGNKKSAQKSIVIRCWHEGNRYVYSVEDEGSGFRGNISQVIPPLIEERGRGLMSIRKYTDSLEFNPKGNRITFSISPRRTI